MRLLLVLVPPVNCGVGKGRSGEILMCCSGHYIVNNTWFSMTHISMMGGVEASMVNKPFFYVRTRTKQI